MGAARRDVREDQETHLVAAMAGHDDILRQWCERGNPGDAQRADADPGAGIELEIFGDAAVEEQPEFRPRGIGEFHGIADQIEALGVESLRGQFRRFPVARRDVRPRTRTSSLSPEGTSFNSVPGIGTPILPERLAWK